MCWYFKKTPSSECEEENDNQEFSQTRTSKGRKKKRRSSSRSDKEETTVSMPRKKCDYNNFFEKQEPLKQLVFSQRLSTIAHDRVVNTIDLPLRLRHGNKVNEICTPEQFATMMGFIVAKELGSGSYGKVFLMNKHIPGKDGRINVYQMACKKLRLVDNNDARSLRHLASLRGELFVLQSLRGLCPYLIEYIEHYCLRYRKGTEMLLEASIYMEFADGGTLFHEVMKKKKKVIEVALARRYFSEMAQGLHFLHLYKISHNDFKLENVLLVSDPSWPKVKHCKLSDFGMAQFAYKEGKGVLFSEKFHGTPAFMAPEVLQCRLSEIKHFNYVPFKADIWSLGVSLYIMVIGAYPFDYPRKSTKEAYQTVIHQMKKGVFSSKKLAKKIDSETLVNLLQGMLDYNPDSRLSIDLIVKHSWLH